MPERPSVSATNGVKKPRKKRESVSRYPLTVSFNITPGMAQSLLRMTAIGGPLTQSQYGRLLLHRGLLQDDPVYRQQMEGSNHA
jgi:hypothetical protein